MSIAAKRKKELGRLLAAGDFDGIQDMARVRGGVVRALIGLSYEKQEVSAWRAMDAMGRICAGEPESQVRNTIERLLWMMREESGTNPWSAAEILGEILHRKPDRFTDIIPIVITFADEMIMREGALRTMWRVGQVRPELVAELAHVPLEHCEDENPQVRGYAALALRVLKEGAPGRDAALSILSGDKAGFLLYDNTQLVETTVSSVAGPGGNGTGGI